MTQSANPLFDSIDEIQVKVRMLNRYREGIKSELRQTVDGDCAVVDQVDHELFRQIQEIEELAGEAKEAFQNTVKPDKAAWYLLPNPYIQKGKASEPILRGFFYYPFPIQRLYLI